MAELKSSSATTANIDAAISSCAPHAGEGAHYINNEYTTRDRRAGRARTYRVRDYIDAIEFALSLVTDNDRACGERFYRRMALITAGHAARLGIPTLHAAGVYAAHSINTDWGVTLPLAARTLRNKTLHRNTLTMNINKAHDMMTGTVCVPMTLAKDADALKVKNFALACAGVWSVVVVDRWACSIALGWSECPNGGRPCGRNGRHSCQRVPVGAEYRAMADAYKVVAARHGILPSMLQAMTWVAARKVK